MKKLIAHILSEMMLTLTDCDSNNGEFSQDVADKLQKGIDRLQDELNNAKGNTGDNNQSNSHYASASVGDIIEFGGYDWRVLDVQSGKALILSDKVLTSQKYHSTSTTWETCDLRGYFNGFFMTIPLRKMKKI